MLSVIIICISVRHYRTSKGVRSNPSNPPPTRQAVMWNSLPTNPTAAVSFLIINKLINHTSFMENRHFVIVFILLLLDLISSRQLAVD